MIGAEVGIPLAKIGGYMSTFGATISVINNLYYNALSSGKAWKTAGFYALGKVSEHYAGKISGFEGLGVNIMKQNAGLKVMAVDRYTDSLMYKN